MFGTRTHVRLATTSRWLRAGLHYSCMRLALCFRVLRITAILIGLSVSFMMLRIGRGQRLAPAHGLARVTEVNARL